MSKINQPELLLELPANRRPSPPADIHEELRGFSDFGTSTRIFETSCATADSKTVRVQTYVNEFWTAKQRACHSLHEISYRACFKPQLPRFFIERLTQPGDSVYDPFLGRGTTLLESALLDRHPVGCDINPLSQVLLRPRLAPPMQEEVHSRLTRIELDDHDEFPEDLLVFYHPDTLKEIAALKKYLLSRIAGGTLDPVDEWIRMVAVNRLTGHSPGFFSVYTLPPNQATSVKAQMRINERRTQTQPRRHIKPIILKKSKNLLSDLDLATKEKLCRAGQQSLIVTRPASSTPAIPSNTIALVVTSPPFLDIVDYAQDNWLRCWFVGIDPRSVALTVPKKLEKWKAAMTEVFHELARVVTPGGHVAFEVGEVRGGTIKLEETVVACGLEAGLRPELILINDQAFTKTANCWGVDNQSKGTNTNRIVLFQKP